jgi:hypothetical protein
MKYQCEATSVAGFIQRVAANCVAHGYFRYVIGTIPERKDPIAVDRKMIQRFGVVDKSARHRRKEEGLANVLYIRYQRTFVLLVSDYGRNEAFEEEGKMIRDVRDVPIKIAGHSIAYKAGRVHVRIESGLYRRLKEFLCDHALRRSRSEIEQAFGRLSFEAYAPVRSQLLCILRAVNRRRKTANAELVDRSCLRLYRRFPSIRVALPATSESTGKTIKIRLRAKVVEESMNDRESYISVRPVESLPLEAAFI